MNVANKTKRDNEKKEKKMSVTRYHNDRYYA